MFCGGFMYLKKINISGVAGIDKLSIDFNRKMNIVCGPNGIGKTTILECVAQAFSGQQSNILKRRVSSESGEVKAFISVNDVDREVSFPVSVFVPTEGDFSSFRADFSKFLLSLKVARSFSYSALTAVSRDVQKSDHAVSTENKVGLNIGEVKNWFVNRYMYSPHEGALTPVQAHNLALAKTFFGLLNSGFQFSRVDAGSNEIMVNTPAGEIYYEYLSSGFKSCLSILFGIVKELEFRFKDPGVMADEFKGVILVDELELHLHPEWQAKIAQVLTQAFPNAQFIVTTHSPHVIQAAQPEEVLALESTGGKIFKRELPDTKYGFQGWSIEEVLKDVMGMSDTRTSVYQEALSSFEEAVDNEDFDNALIAFNKLDALLHPENHLRKLLAFQLGALKG